MSEAMSEAEAIEAWADFDDYDDVCFGYRNGCECSNCVAREIGI